MCESLSSLSCTSLTLQGHEGVLLAGNMPPELVGFRLLIVLLLLTGTEETPADHLPPESSLLKPTVLITILARNTPAQPPSLPGMHRQTGLPEGANRHLVLFTFFSAFITSFKYGEWNLGKVITTYLRHYVNVIVDM